MTHFGIGSCRPQWMEYTKVQESFDAQGPSQISSTDIYAKVYTISNCCSHIKAIEASNKIWCSPPFMHLSSLSPFTAMRGTHMTSSTDVSVYTGTRSLYAHVCRWSRSNMPTQTTIYNDQKTLLRKEVYTMQLTHYRKLLSLHCGLTVYCSRIPNSFPPPSPYIACRPCMLERASFVCRTPLPGMHRSLKLGFKAKGFETWCTRQWSAVKTSARQ